jgi:two-component system, OmpR family, alkaline phosphatase synthesis response regulator PhoP
MAKILIIEDQEPLSGLYRSVLRQFHHETTFAHTGEAGVEAALRERPDLIILDLLLPNMTGAEVAQRLLDAHILPEVPLIVTTALDEVDAQSIANSLNATAVLHKPFNIGSIVSTVDYALACANHKLL